jgi:hypothetical protein
VSNLFNEETHKSDFIYLKQLISIDLQTKYQSSVTKCNIKRNMRDWDEKLDEINISISKCFNWALDKN